jgi:hypothetical protein
VTCPLANPGGDAQAGDECDADNDLHAGERLLASTADSIGRSIRRAQDRDDGNQLCERAECRSVEAGQDSCSDEAERDADQREADGVDEVDVLGSGPGRGVAGGVLTRRRRSRGRKWQR